MPTLWEYLYLYILLIGVDVQLLSHVWLFEIPWTEARQASLSFIICQRLLKLMSIKWVMPSNHLILCRPLLLLPSIFPASGSFPMNQLFSTGGQSIGVKASVLILSMNIQGWLSLELTGLIPLLSEGLSRVFSSATVWNLIAVRVNKFFKSLLNVYIRK